MTKEKLTKLLITLFESKMKNYTATTLEVWFTELEKFPEKYVEAAIRKEVYSTDDFPSVGKLADNVKSYILDYLKINILRGSKIGLDICKIAKLRHEYCTSETIEKNYTKILKECRREGFLLDQNREELDYERDA